MPNMRTQYSATARSTAREETPTTKGRAIESTWMIAKSDRVSSVDGE